MTDHYDAIIVGAGAGGGIAAGVLTEAGKRVLLIERGGWIDLASTGRDHVRNQRISLYGHNAGPAIDRNPRVFVDPLGRETTVRPHEGGYNNNAAAVGGGTTVYGAQSWRFMEKDFRMAATYGVPEGSSLADWPIEYSDLEPYYERAEWEIGVAGEDEGNRYQAPRRRGYPMPPVPPTTSNRLLRSGADALGWNTFPTPLAINTVPRAGREACIQCDHCVGFPCPSNAKNGTQNTMIPRALKTGLCDLVIGAMVERIDTDARGRVIGVTYLVDLDATRERRTAVADVVICSAGAIETARLLLNSDSRMHPAGLGNEHDLVGRSLQGHYYPSAQALFDQQLYDGQGPGVSISTCRFNHGNPGIVGGGMLSDEFIKLPIIFWYRSHPGDIPRWGARNKQWMRESYGRTSQLMGPVQDIPSPDARVTIDPSVRDAFGIPVARLSGTTHPETLKTAEFMRQRAIEWLKASGAIKVWSAPSTLGLSGGQHQAGTCRMGDDPRASVTDRWGRVHGHDNLYVMDASLHVTNGGFNPVLTVMALSFRCSEHLAAL